MDKQEFQKYVCRICLDENAERNWNEFLHEQNRLTYKDCYRKFTGLDCFDEDNLSTVLCRNCCNCLENMNIFISKAIENHYILLEKHSLNLLKQEVDDIKQNTSFEVILLEEMDIKPDIHTLEDYSKHLVQQSETCSSSELNSSPVAQSESLQKAIETNNKEENIHPIQLTKSHMSSKKTRKPLKTPTCCSICSKVLVSKYAAIKHEKTHETRERSVVCPECGVKFYCKMALRNHAQVHSENRKTHKCDFCEKSFLHKGGLNIHRRIHLGQMITCTICSKQYYRLIDLDKHMISHSASRINGEVIPRKKIFVRCEYCGENIRSTNYKSHTARHTNDPLCKCSICDKTFFSRDSCIAHLKSVHKKGNGERGNFIVDLKANRRCTSLFMQQNASKIFIEE